MIYKISVFHLGKEIQNKEFSFDQEVILGRGSQVAFPIKNRKLSRSHALLEIEDNKLFLTDLGSSNGSFIQGEKLIPNTRRPLDLGQEIKLGPEISLKIEAFEEEASFVQADGSALGMSKEELTQLGVNPDQIYIKTGRHQQKSATRVFDPSLMEMTVSKILREHNIDTEKVLGRTELNQRVQKELQKVYGQKKRRGLVINLTLIILIVSAGVFYYKMNRPKVPQYNFADTPFDEKVYFEKCKSKLEILYCGTYGRLLGNFDGFLIQDNLAIKFVDLGPYLVHPTQGFFRPDPKRHAAAAQVLLSEVFNPEMLSLWRTKKNFETLQVVGHMHVLGLPRVYGYFETDLKSSKLETWQRIQESTQKSWPELKQELPLAKIQWQWFQL